MDWKVESGVWRVEYLGHVFGVWCRRFNLRELGVTCRVGVHGSFQVSHGLPK